MPIKFQRNVVTIQILREKTGSSIITTGSMPRKAQGGLDVLDVERVLIDDDGLCVATSNEGRKMYVE